ncbi:reverse transcriptase [Gossypium australe]|uniref:Reverse transcriptase n=1 Tax=Gossypium australe TaxID=47621 RepID=A0A5B6WH84_9ROSI|nr:reverse transcriptase [Gossypium australe]
MILPVKGCDLVLGIQWLLSLGPIIWNFSSLTMQFDHMGRVISYSSKTKIERLIQEMLQAGIIYNSISPFASPMVMVKKKDDSWRLCIDYRQLNQLTIKDRFPIPVIEELLDELGQANFLSKLDLRSSYHQIRMWEKDVHKTTFETHEGHYEFLVMRFGLTNAPSNFQGLMGLLLCGMGVVSMDKEKVESVLNWPLAQSVKELRGSVDHQVIIEETDASGQGVVVVLQKKGKPVAFFSKALGVKHQTLSIYYKEMLAGLLAVKKWHPYLIGRHFLIKTDHQSLRFILDTKLQQLCQELQLQPELHPKYFWDGRVIKRLGKIVVGHNDQLRKHIFDIFHGGSLRGHSGRHATRHRILGLLYWKGLSKNVKRWVRECVTFQRCKVDNTTSPGLLQPLPIPERAWTTISMDFVEGKSTILVVVDRLTKYGHFITLVHPFTVVVVAQEYLNQVYKIHGIPESIVSDRNRALQALGHQTPNVYCLSPSNGWTDSMGFSSSNSGQNLVA